MLSLRHTKPFPTPVASLHIAWILTSISLTLLVATSSASKQNKRVHTGTSPFDKSCVIIVPVTDNYFQ